MQKMSLDEFLKNPTAKKQKPSLDAFLGAQQPMQQQSAGLEMPIEQLKRGQPSISQGISNLANNPFVQAINSLGGRAAEGITKGAAQIGNLPLEALSAMGVPIDARFQGIKAPFVNRGDKAAELFGEATQFALPGGIAAKGVAGLQGFKGANLLRNILGGSLGGGLGSEASERGQNALLGGAAAGALPYAGKAIGGLKNLVTNPSKYNPLDIMNKLSSNFYNTISGGLDKNALNAKNASGIVKNYLEKKNIGSNKYENFLNQAEKMGYVPNVKMRLDTATGKVIPTGNSKAISLSKGTSNAFKEILMPKAGDNIKPLSKDLKEMLSVYKSNPSLRNAQSLQSKLFAESNDFLGNVNRDTADKVTGKKLNLLREKVNSDIQKSIGNYGDTGLGEQIREAGNYWAKNVVPYTKVPDIRRLVVKGDHPSNILNSLSRTTPSYNAIREHVLENPELQKSLFAQQLSQKAKSQLGKEGKRIKLNEATEQYLKAPDILKDIFNEESVNSLNNLNKGNKLLKLLGGLSGIGGGYEFGRHF